MKPGNIRHYPAFTRCLLQLNDKTVLSRTGACCTDFVSSFFRNHYSDVIMSATASQITGVSMVCSTVCSDADKKTSKLRVTGLCEGNSPVTGEFPSQRASNAENVSIWWRRHVQTRRTILLVVIPFHFVPITFSGIWIKFQRIFRKMGPCRLQQIKQFQQITAAAKAIVRHK